MSEGLKEGPGQTEDERDLAFLTWLRNTNGYLVPTQVGDHWVAVQQLMYHGSLIGGAMHDECSVNYRYCYADTNEAFRAMVVWIANDCHGEPEGWHKSKGRPMLIPPPGVRIRAIPRIYPPTERERTA